MIALHQWRDNGPGTRDARLISRELCASATATVEAKQYRDGDNVRVRAERKIKAPANTVCPALHFAWKGT
jgi:hypothetical protein